MEYFNDYYSSFLQSISNYLPGVVGAILVLFIGWLVASGLRRLTQSLLKRTNLDNRLFKRAKSTVSPEKFLAKLVYYSIMVVVLLVVLEMLGVRQVLDPLKEMASEFFGFVPNVIAALVIGYVGYIIATIASELVGIGGSAFESISDRLGITSESMSLDLNNILKKVVFILIFIPVLIAAIDVLNIKAISDPATSMLSIFVSSIPSIVAAAVIIAVFIIGGKFIASLLNELFTSLGVDVIAKKLQIGDLIGDYSLSKLLANLAFFFIVFFGLITGIEKLGFYELNEILSDLLHLSGRVLFGIVILILGNYFSNLAYKSVSKGKESQVIANIAKYAILVLFLGIALNQMGIADKIVNLAFGLTLGAIAVAIALSFGLGGREAAGKQMEYIFKKLRGEK
ncbi:mechanosensitive ion channel [Membranihabitans marinus]|uniref:mechanosensitive ion channel n=1 Tax=Membranihabitans marinus TaxID=1227546 RepID=UPI001F032B45|nr:mechanosensitive ion channel [Membranihabitans marinus]